MSFSEELSEIGNHSVLTYGSTPSGLVIGPILKPGLHPGLLKLKPFRLQIWIFLAQYLFRAYPPKTSSGQYELTNPVAFAKASATKEEGECPVDIRCKNRAFPRNAWMKPGHRPAGE